MRARMLLVGDGCDLASGLKQGLGAKGYHVTHVEKGGEGLTHAKEKPFDLVLTDWRLPGLSGLEFVQQLRAAKPQIPIILMTGCGNEDIAMQATRLGASDLLIKPFHIDELLQVAAKVLTPRQFPPVVHGTEPIGFPLAGMVGGSRAMQKVYRDIGLAADTTMTVLIRGDTGTGKELVARAIHQNSGRTHKPFVAVNCTAIPETLVESEFFGHERGAFTGAHARRIGFFEQAHGGTLFLDEIGDLSPATQVKLLRVLQERSVQRLGGREKVAVDVRILAATHCNLELAIRERRFRQDLFYRLCAFTIRLPRLAERVEDIPELVHCFLKLSKNEVSGHSNQIHDEAMEFLKVQNWLGNVRELENVVRHAVLLAGQYDITLAHVREACCASDGQPPDGDLSVEEFVAQLIAKAEKEKVPNLRAHIVDKIDRELFRQAVQRAAGNQAKAARWLNVTRNTMRENQARFGLE
ncbi:MAG TPA: sigma-54 dependent transcriptional regulator [Clostridia bacterium]|nr:sigma-54 dependent transcriptional regulator [Clostridia bacterium]